MSMPPARPKPPSVRVVLTAFLSLAVVVVPVALGAKGGNTRKSHTMGSTPLALVSETVWNSPNPAAPTWCLNEDDYHKRTWSGSLSGSFAATEQLCGTDADYSGGMWWGAGGVGLRGDLYATGALSDLTITSPRGDTHGAVLVGSSTSNGVTTNHFEVCYVPPFAVSSNTGGMPLPGGTWQITLSGNVTHATFTVSSAMADVTFQQTYCPVSEQNLVP
jgi:hypothetical protein